MTDGQGGKGRGMRFKATDGTVFWVNGDSCFDYVLHPVFLHYFIVCVLIFALLDPGGPGDLPTGWHITVSWVIVAAVAILWLTAMTWVQRALWRKRWINMIYLPIYLVPMVILVDLARKTFEIYVAGIPFGAVSPFAAGVVQDCFAVLLFDILHARYVTRAHPNAQLEEVQPAPTPLAGPAEDTAAPAPEEASPRQTVQIGTTTFDLDDILTVRTRDHRVEVTTTKGSSLHRARLSDIPELQDPRFGLQISRALWVSFNAITEVSEPEPGQTEIQLRTGAVERVSRPRQIAFRQAWRTRSSADPAGPKRQKPAQPLSRAS